MLETVSNILFRVSDLRNKVLFTLGVIVLYEFGANVPSPYVDYTSLRSAAHASTGILGYLNLFSGGALLKVAVFGLGIMPYITSSIIIQLLVTVIPKLEEWRDQGAVGQKKLTQTTRYLTVSLALMQSMGLVYAFHGHNSGIFGSASSQDFILHYSIWRAAFIVMTLTAGTAFVMWLGELITQRGIGQGMSILIFCNVVATIPSNGDGVLQAAGKLKFAVILLVSLGLIVAIVTMELGQRRIPVTFAKRVVGRKMYGGSSTYIPLKVNQSGVIPIIFASSVLYIPVLLSNIIPNTWFQHFVNNRLQATDLTYIAIYFTMILLFTFFYVHVAFDPIQQADTIRKQGGYIPAIRPGKPTEVYLTKVLNRITVPGALFLASVAVVPSLLMALWNIKQYPFYGTTLLIATGVALETMKQIDSQLMMRNYEGFLSR